MQWFKALRPLCGIVTALLVISGFRHSNQQVNYSVVVAVFFITCFAMLCNDYYDRELDIGKGRILASTHPNLFLLYVSILGAISFCACIFTLFSNLSFGLLCFAMLVTSAAYNRWQNKPIVKNMVVSLNISATVVFSLLVDKNIPRLWLMAIFVFAITAVREFMKDVEDMEVDRGHKKTLALVFNSKIKKSTAVRWQLFLALLLIALTF